MKLRWLLYAALALVLLAGGTAAAGWSWFRGAVEPVSADAPEVLFTVERGSSFRKIARELVAADLARDVRALRLLGRWKELDSGLRAGEYRLSGAMSSEEILGRLARGEVATWDVVVPEGFTAAMIGERLAAEGLVDEAAFAAVVNDPEAVAALGVEGQTLEGYLFPETYHFARGLPAVEIAHAFVEQFLVVWREIEPKATEQGFSMQDVVTLASIVEKETGAPQERPLIASVFRNRMERGMRLETDPTVIYGIPNFDGNLRRKDLENRSNPYNTYVIPGLPPGPIASPGAAALRAVVHPADSEYLFFVSKNDGTHIFSRTYREHASAVDRYQRRGSR